MNKYNFKQNLKFLVNSNVEFEARISNLIVH